MDLGSDRFGQRLAVPVIGDAWVEREDPEEASKRLRISLTDRCNLACFFCHNEGQGAASKDRHALSVADYGRIAQAARRAGIRSVKLTGGEPTIYRAADGDVTDVIRAIREAYGDGGLDLSMTTNGVLLADRAQDLKNAGLDRLTVSLSSLRNATHRTLLGGRRSSPAQVIQGLEAARLAELAPIKVNMVLFGPARGTAGNLDEIADVIELCRKLDVAELRLYPMLGADSSTEMTERYAYWGKNLMSVLTLALQGPCGEVPETLLGVLDDVSAGRYDTIADTSRFTLRVYIGDLFLALNMMRSDRHRRSADSSKDGHHCQEGVYALRLAANGDLRVCLEQPPIATLSPQLSSEGSINSLAATFAAAQEEFITHHSS